MGSVRPLSTCSSCFSDLGDRNSTYTFSPVTGLIHLHTIDSIHPEPHQAVYDALRSSLGNVFGLGLKGSGGPRAGEAACKSASCQYDNEKSKEH